MTGSQDGAPTVYVVGAAGQLGSALLRSPARPADLRVVGLTSADVDVASRDAVRAAFTALRAGDIVINASAYTDVDGAESDRDAAFAVNADGPRHLAEVTAAASARLVHVSTDYVFAARDARATAVAPLEPADLVPGAEPATVYGASKLAGEEAAVGADPRTVLVRTAWVFTGSAPVRDFVTTMSRLEAERDRVQVVDDQRGSPTYARDLAAGIWELVGRVNDGAIGESGVVLHATNSGEATWCDLARAVFAGRGADPNRVQPCTTDEFPRPASRPAYSVLSGRSWTDAGLTPLRDWRDALAEALATPV